ncbi:MAG: MaoC family dehydratase N-terminal domain-containing protein [Ectothiorhodospiraceae bacterium]|nr:MaoC family dehydratase N-terminal domain-containing protein [Ectothiorhodospiraceae bacterium]
MSQTDARLQDWIGRTRELHDTLTPVPAKAMAATLDLMPLEKRGALPPLWHWLYFLPTAPTAELGDDGHPAKGGFLPPVPLPRRMWAGTRARFHQPLHLEDPVRCTSRIADVVSKEGRSGALVIVTVVHEIHGPQGLAITEEQDLVYREEPRPGAKPVPPVPAPAEPQWSHGTSAGPVLLFRYSALTFNGHRIHYDHPYATEVEGYPGLVVHGPLVLTLLVETLRQEHPDARIQGLSMRALRPLFHNRPFRLQGCLSEDGSRATLWSLDEHHAVTMQVDVTLAR